MTPEQETLLLDLVEKHISETLSEDEAKQLENMVIADKQIAKLYSQLMKQHALLHLSAAHMGESLELKSEPNVTRFYAWKVLVAAAALLIVAFSLWTLSDRSLERQAIAIVTDSKYAVWGECTVPTAKDVELSAGKMNLLEGLVTLQFNSGAEMILEGPVEIDLIDAMKTRLHSGIVVTEIPESAKGFTILTPTSKAIDHGTKFLTQVSENGESTIVNVLEGEVEVVHEQRGSHHIFDGEMIKTTSADLQQKQFTGEIGLGYSGESTSSIQTVSTLDGRGADGTAFKMNKRHHYNPELVMIKNSDNDYNRKGYLRFDLSGIAMAEVSAVSLDFHMVHSQYGSLALSEELARFSVYALTDHSLDEWDRGLINWQRAPGNAPGSSEVQADKTRKLGEFTLPRGKVFGLISFQSPELLEAVQNDSNKLMTLIIVHESLGDQVGNNYVYAIASGKHPSLAAPNLKFK